MVGYKSLKFARIFIILNLAPMRRGQMESRKESWIIDWCHMTKINSDWKQTWRHFPGTFGKYFSVKFRILGKVYNFLENLWTFNIFWTFWYFSSFWKCIELFGKLLNFLVFFELFGIFWTFWYFFELLKIYWAFLEDLWTLEIVWSFGNCWSFLIVFEHFLDF